VIRSIALRTSVLGATRFAGHGASTLAVFGAGAQATAHVEAFGRAFHLRSVRIVSRGGTERLAEHARRLLRDCDVRTTDARDALRGAQIVVTATRSATPIFAGADVEAGAFVAAVGSSKPDAREIDDALIARTSLILVEWREQALREAGDLVMADPGALDGVSIVELGVKCQEVVSGPS
jgi:ornithine cyclodeaminase